MLLRQVTVSGKELIDGFRVTMQRGFLAADIGFHAVTGRAHPVVDPTGGIRSKVLAPGLSCFVEKLLYRGQRAAQARHRIYLGLGLIGDNNPDRAHG